MHELSVTQSVLNIALETAKNNGASQITAINLVIGDMTSIVDDSVQFYFDILGKDTLAQGATLNFRREPATATCLDCRSQIPATPPLTPVCPNCNSTKLTVSGGKEFYIESIEVNDDN